MRSEIKLGSILVGWLLSSMPIKICWRSRGCVLVVCE